MRGTTTIELTDVKTGKKEIVKHDNMITNAVADVLQLNPFGVGYRGVNLAGLAFPLAGKLLGGIQLFAEPLEEDADKYFAPFDNPVVGYASMDVNPGADSRRGSLNQVESGALPNRQGYRFVWDFATSQGNGTIAALGLCGVNGGKASAGGEFLSDTALSKLYTATLYGATRKDLCNIIHIDPENNCCYSIYMESSKAIRIKKIKLPFSSFGLTDDIYINPETDMEDVAFIATESFGYLPYTSASSYEYLAFCYDDDGYIWGFQHDGNADGNSSGNALIRWIKIDVSDWSYEEGSWTINATLYSFGKKRMDVYESKTHCIVHHGKLYCLAYSRYGIYRIDLSNPTDISVIPEAGRAEGSHVQLNVPYAINGYNESTFFNVAGDTIIFHGGHIVNDVAHCRSLPANSATVSLCEGENPKMQYGPFMFTFANRFWGASNASTDMLTFIVNTYLATINNLGQAVEKTADKTMKITYTLYETDPEDDTEDDTE